MIKVLLIGREDLWQGLCGQALLRRQAEVSYTTSRPARQGRYYDEIGARSQAPAASRHVLTVRTFCIYLPISKLSRHLLSIVNTATMTSSEQLTYTSSDDIPKIAGSLRNTFASQQTKPIQWRLVQLRKLYWAYVKLIAYLIVTKTPNTDKGP